MMSRAASRFGARSTSQIGVRQFNRERVEQGLPTYANPATPRPAPSGSSTHETPRSGPWISSCMASATRSPSRRTTSGTHCSTLRRWALKSTPNNTLVRTAEEVVDYYRVWLEKMEGLDYGCDGVVVKINRLDYQRHLGYVGQDPRWAVAYKFPATQSVTQVLDIDVNVGRTGSMNPYAILEPVDIGGATVKQATLHNEDYIVSKGLLIKDWVVVERARRGDPADRERDNGPAYGATSESSRCHRSARAAFGRWSDPRARL